MCVIALEQGQITRGCICSESRPFFTQQLTIFFHVFASLGISASFPFYYSISYSLCLIFYESVQWVSSPNSNHSSFSLSSFPFSLLPSLFPFLLFSLPHPFYVFIFCIKPLITYLQSHFICIILDKSSISWILRCSGFLPGILPALTADREMEASKESI